MFDNMRRRGRIKRARETLPEIKKKLVSGELAPGSEEWEQSKDQYRNGLAQWRKDLEESDIGEVRDRTSLEKDVMDLAFHLMVKDEGYQVIPPRAMFSEKDIIEWLEGRRKKRGTREMIVVYKNTQTGEIKHLPVGEEPPEGFVPFQELEATITSYYNPRTGEREGAREHSMSAPVERPAALTAEPRTPNPPVEPGPPAPQDRFDEIYGRLECTDKDFIDFLLREKNDAKNIVIDAEKLRAEKREVANIPFSKIIGAYLAPRLPPRLELAYAALAFPMDESTIQALMRDKVVQTVEGKVLTKEIYEFIGTDSCSEKEGRSYFENGQIPAGVHSYQVDGEPRYLKLRLKDLARQQKAQPRPPAAKARPPSPRALPRPPAAKARPPSGAVGAAGREPEPVHMPPYELKGWDSLEPDAQMRNLGDYIRVRGFGEYVGMLEEVTTGEYSGFGILRSGEGLPESVLKILAKAGWRRKGE